MMKPFRMSHFRRLSILSLGLSVCGLGAASVAAEDAAPKKVTYEEDVRPIFRQHCFTCHNQNEKKGGLALDTYASTIEGGSSGEVVFDGDSEASRLWMLMAHEDTPVMPPGQDPLDAKVVDVVKQWIDLGLLENQGSKVKKRKANKLAFTASADGKPEGPAAMPETVWKQPVVVTERPGAVTAIASSPWAPLVAIGGQSQVVLYNSDTGQLAGILPFPEGEPQSLNFSRDGSYLLVGGGQHSYMGFAALYDVKTGDRVAKAGDELDIAFGSDINDVLTRVAVGGPKRLVHVHDLATGEQVFELKKHTDWVYDVEYSPDGVLIASGDRSGGLILWEASTGRFYLDLAGHKGAVRDIAWRADSNIVASASLDGTVKLWEIFNGKQVKSFNAHGGGVTSIDMARDGRMVTCGKDRRVKVWDANGSMLKEFPPMPEAVLEVSFTHDGKRVVAGDWSGAVKMWAVDDPNQTWDLSPNPPTLEARLAAAQQSAKAAADDFAAKSSAAQQLDAQFKQLSQQLAGFNQNLGPAMQAVEKAKADLQNAQNAATKAQQQLAAATEALAAAQAEVAKQQPAMQAKRQEFDQLTTDLAQKRAALDTAVATRDQAAANLAILDKQIRDTADANARTPLLAQRETAAKDLATKAAAVQAALSGTQTAQQAVKAAAEAMLPIDQAFTAAQTALGAQQAAVAQSRLSDTTTSHQLQAATAASQAADAALAKLQSDIQSTTKAMEAVKPPLDAANQAVAQATANRDATAAAVAQLQADLDAFRTARETLVSSETALQEQVTQLTQQVEQAQQASAQADSQLTTESTELDKIKAQLEALQAKVNALRSEKRKQMTAAEEASEKASELDSQRQQIADRRALYEAAYGGE